MEYRIEQLAQAAGMAVDTIRFYQGKGLLPAPRREGRVTWYDAAHLERLRRIRALQQRGFTLTVIRRFLDGELASSDEALVEAVTAPAPPTTLSVEELAEQSGIAVPLLRNLEAAGLLVPEGDGDGDPDSPRFPAEDVEALAAGLKLLEAGVPLPALLELATAHAEATETTARGAVELFDRHVRKRIQAERMNSDDAEGELLRVFNELLEASGLLVRHHFQRTLLRAARERIERARE